MGSGTGTGIDWGSVAEWAIPAVIGAAGDALTAASMPEGQQLRSFGPEAGRAIREAQGLARDQLARSQALAEGGTFFPELNLQGMVGDVNVPGLAPGLIGIKQGTVDLINSPIGGPGISATPAPSGDGGGGLIGGGGGGGGPGGGAGGSGGFEMPRPGMSEEGDPQGPGIWTKAPGIGVDVINLIRRLRSGGDGAEDAASISSEDALGDPEHPFSSAAEREQALNDIATLISALQNPLVR